MVVSDVDLDLLDEQRVSGTVIPLNDMIRDAYDRVIHYLDRTTGGDQAAETGMRPGNQGLLNPSLVRKGG